MNLVRELEYFGYRFYFNPDQRFAGNDFKQTLEFEINRSLLYMIFISRDRNIQGIMNFEIDCIRRAYKKLRNEPRIILILLDDLSEMEMCNYIEPWLLNEGLAYVKYLKGRSKEVKAELLRALDIWSRQFKLVPPGIASRAEGNMEADRQSKEVLGYWVLKNLPSTLCAYTTMFIGCGTTVYELWLRFIRNFIIKSDRSEVLHTNNEFILYNESEIKKEGKASVSLKKAGDNYLKEYATHCFTKPAKEFPQVEFSLISVSGFKVENGTLNLRICWQEMSASMNQVLHKTSKEILIVAAGRKIIESDGAGDIELMPLLMRDPSLRKRKLTLVVDTKVNPAKREVFEEKVTLLSKFLGPPQKCNHYSIIYWQTTI